MRQFARGLVRGRARQVATPRVTDAAIHARLNQSMRRRMSDELVTLIRRACLCGHAETAKGLWVVLRDLLAREAGQRFPNGRLHEKGLLEKLAVEIATAAARDSHGSPPSGS